MQCSHARGEDVLAPDRGAAASPEWPAAEGRRGGRLVHHLFEEQARRTPDAVAVTCRSESWSYRELDRRAAHLARHFRALGVGRGSLVGLCVDRSAGMVAGLLGILKAGGAYVPLDPSYPRDRLAFMLEDSGAAFLLIEGPYEGLLPGFRGTTLSLDGGRDAAPDGDGDPAGGAAADDPAYVIYTSGSTSRPKGVVIEHGPVANLLDSMRREPGLTDRDVLAAVTTLSFDIHVPELFLPLIVGARVEVVPREVASDGVRLLDRLGRAGATVLQATPATWRMLLEAGWSPGLRLVKALSGGEPLTRRLADRLLERSDEVWNLYGPTEATVWSTAHRVAPGDGPVAIGRPIAGTRAYVLEGRLRPVPDGEVGELYLGGAGLARGYLRRPDLTAERFPPDPFSGRPGARLYRTGDLARLLPDGTIDCLGRIDHQVKVRGFRIEPGEVEAALCGHPGVREAVVAARDDDAGERRLVAYFVPAHRPVPAPRELAEAIGARVPAYMVPSAFVALDALPLTPNGKVDRAALPPPGDARPDLGRAVARPADAIEGRLQVIWEEVLGVRPVGVEDDFFELGGDSVRSMALLVRIEEEFGRTFYPSALLQEGTIRRIAHLLAEGPDLRSASPLVQLRPGAGRPLYALRAPGLDGAREPSDRIEALAALYLEQVRSVQPRRPYLFAGHSFGAVVAFEMAQQLRDAGQRVDYLAILDQLAPRAGRGDGGGLAHAAWVASRFARWASVGLLRPGRAADAVAVARCLRALAGKARYRLRRARARMRGRLFIESDITAAKALPLPIVRVMEAHDRAERRYRPRGYPGRLVLYRVLPEFPWFRPGLDDLGWGRYALGGLEVRTISGDHHSLLKNPHAGPLAARIEADLAELGA